MFHEEEAKRKLTTQHGDRGYICVCAHAPGYECVSVHMRSPRRSEKGVRFHETIVIDGYELSMEVLGSEPRSSGSAAHALNS